MNTYIKSKRANCKNCYKCIRHCPVKSIRFSDNQAYIVEDECIMCGRCYVVCPQNAKYVSPNVEDVKRLIEKGEEVYVSIAPSFVANYQNSTFSGMEKALKKLGFAGVEETAIGATIVKTEYEEMIKRREQKVLISSCCHTINTLIQKKFPEALSYLAAIDTPMVAHCKKIKKEHENAKIVFIGPCISKKAEADQYQEIVDYVLTFEELSSWLEEEEIQIESIEDTGVKGRARMFPTTGGIIKSMIQQDENYTYVSIDGVKNCMRALRDIIDGKMENCFVEMSACIGSCIGGPAMSREQRHPVSDLITVAKFSGEKDFEIETVPDIKKEIPYIGVHQNLPGNAQIEEILHSMGKKTKEDELNCGSCGYNTCREKAVAVYLGKAEISMCLPYLKEKAESFSDTIIGNTPNGIIVLNEQLEVQQINKSACEMLNIKHASDILNCPVVRILDPIDFITVSNTKQSIREKRVYLAEYEKYIEETITYDKNSDVIILIMRDVSEEERQVREKEKLSKHTVEITDKVIEKQMRVVQEIALLLGETTAETKIALSNLKETLENE